MVPVLLQLLLGPFLLHLLLVLVSNPVAATLDAVEECTVLTVLLQQLLLLVRVSNPVAATSDASEECWLLMPAAFHFAHIAALMSTSPGMQQQ